MDKRLAPALIVVCLVVGLIVVGIALRGEGGNGYEGYAEYVSEEYGFSLKYPENWREENVLGVIFYRSAPGGLASFNLTATPTPRPGMTMEELVVFAREAMENNFPNVSWGENGSVEVDGGEGYEFRLVVENFGGGGMDVALKVDLFLHRDNVYALTFSTLPSFYGSYEGTFNKILRSLRLF